MIPVEPHADIREAAATSFQILQGFMDAGFTREEAFRVVLQMVPGGDDD